MQKPLPETYSKRMRAQLGEEGYAAYRAALERPQKRALRVNTLKIDTEAFCALADFPLEPTGLTPESFFFGDDVAIGKHPLHAAGLCYVQEPSAQVPAELLDARPGMTVLDLCAAPGGKTTQLAAGMRNAGLLVANEIVRSRAEALCGNLERLGVKNALVTCARPDALASVWSEFFERVLVDAPCSGEGMFRKDDSAVADWSPEHVRACALRQREILESAAILLKPGGRLVYATCTFSPDENEETITAFLLRHADFTLLETRRYYPHTSAGEGQFMAVMTRSGGDSFSALAASATQPGAKPVPAFAGFWRETFHGEPPRALALPDGRVFLPPDGFPLETGGLHVLRAGVPAGELDARTGRFTPAHALAMASPADAFLRMVPLEGEPLARFLAGETAACDPALSGWCAATAHGYPVGWGKAVQGVLKNHIPKGLRILR